MCHYPSELFLSLTSANILAGATAADDSRNKRAPHPRLRVRGFCSYLRLPASRALLHRVPHDASEAARGRCHTSTRMTTPLVQMTDDHPPYTSALPRDSGSEMFDRPRPRGAYLDSLTDGDGLRDYPRTREAYTTVVLLRESRKDRPLHAWGVPAVGRGPAPSIRPSPARMGRTACSSRASSSCATIPCTRGAYQNSSKRSGIVADRPLHAWGVPAVLLRSMAASRPSPARVGRTRRRT